MLSRVAESVYWMNRYIERAENIARIIDVNVQLMLDLEVRLEEQWGPTVQITGDDSLYLEKYGAYTKEKVVRFLTFDPDYPSSILSCLVKARENARSVREFISTEMWEHVNGFYLMVLDAVNDRGILDAPNAFLRRVKTASNLCVGVTETTMSHGEGWHFCKLGRMLERADKTTRIVDVKYFVLLPSVDDVGSPRDAIQWAAVLGSASGLEMYRKQHQIIQPSRIIDFLILDREFPRAVRYCLNTADYSLRAISKTYEGSYTNPAEQQLGHLKSELAYVDIDMVTQRGLHDYLDMLQGEINKVGESVHQTFFA